MKKIGIVEDDKTLSNGVAIALKSSEYMIYQAYTLREARELLTEELDLVVLDINLLLWSVKDNRDDEKADSENPL